MANNRPATNPGALVGKTGLGIDKFCALVGLPPRAFVTAQTFEEIPSVHRQRFLDLAARMETGDLAGLKSYDRCPILRAEIVGEIDAAARAVTRRSTPSAPRPSSTAGLATAVKDAARATWVGVGELTGIPVEALRTPKARDLLNADARQRLTELVALVAENPAPKDFRAAVNALGPPSPLVQSVPTPTTNPRPPAATFAEMAQRYGVEVKAAQAWMRVQGGTGGVSRPRQNHLDHLDAMGERAATEINGAVLAALSTLKKRGWTEGLVAKVLGEPDVLLDNPVYRTAAPMRTWYSHRVWAAEAEDAVADALASTTRRRETKTERGERALAEAANRAAAATQEVRSRVQAIVRAPGRAPDAVTLHLGPTNSGKTSSALDTLAERGSGVYAGPLRMLAWEAHAKLAARLGAEAVGMITGEERVNENAPILCCTAESAPDTGDLLVLDEAHWVGDPERGPAWTALLQGEYREVHVAGSRAVRPVLEAVYANAGTCSVHDCARLSRLTYVGPSSPASIPKRSAVIAFSEKAVQAIAGELREHGHRVGMLYGALPPGTRRDQVTKLIAGELDVIVTTDVIGHGVNLPVDAVWFAETTKFDGTRRRTLHLWEMAQIAGRAGRGPGNDGTAGIYVSAMPGLDADENTVKAGVAAASGDRHDGLSIPRVPFGPKLSGLGVTDAAELGVALLHWRHLAAAQASASPVLVPMQVDTLVEKWQRVAQVCEQSTTDLTTSWGIDPAAVWSLMMLPVDAGAPSFTGIVGAALCRKSLRARVGAGYHRDLPGAGARAKELRDIAAAVVTFGDGFGGVSTDMLAEALAEVTATLSTLVNQGNTTGTGTRKKGKRRRSGPGVCVSCGSPCAPWFTECDPCHQDWSWQ